MVPRCAFSATLLVSWVLITMPSVTVVVQLVSGLRWPSTSTMHCRQAPIGSSSGWSQNRGISMPSSSAARMISVPLGTTVSIPSTMTVTESGGGGGFGAPLVVSMAVSVGAMSQWAPASSASAGENIGGVRPSM